MKRQLLTVTAATLAALVVVSGPVMADTSITELGDVGPHSLRDTIHNPGAICEYNTRTDTGNDYEGTLERIHVRPPRMRAFEGSQEVGWRFLIYRRFREGNVYGNFKVIYRSALQVATATETNKADFTWMTVPVAVPADGQDGTKAYDFLVLVRMSWFENHDLSGRSLHEVDDYKGQLNGFPGGSTGTVFGNDCQGWLSTNF